MKKIDIYDHATLIVHIQQVKIIKQQQEDELKTCFSDFVDTLNPMSIIKNSFHELVTDKEVLSDITKVALNMGSNLLIDQVFGKYRSIKGFLKSIVFEKISTAVINSNIIQLLPVASLFKKKQNK